MQLNKVHHITSITRVSADLGEDEDWFNCIAIDIEPEDGLIWVYGPDDDGVMAFSDFGIEQLKELIALHKAHPDLLVRSKHNS